MAECVHDLSALPAQCMGFKGYEQTCMDAEEDHNKLLKVHHSLALVHGRTNKMYRQRNETLVQRQQTTKNFAEVCRIS